MFDSDTETAEALRVPLAVEVPFAPLGPEVRARNRELLERAVAIVVSPFPVGPSNLANLDDLRPFVGRVPILLLSHPPLPPWDFTSGAATRSLKDLEAAGARRVDDLETLVGELRRIVGTGVDPSGAVHPGSG